MKTLRVLSDNNGGGKSAVCFLGLEQLLQVRFENIDLEVSYL
jgi:hypothetical protein